MAAIFGFVVLVIVLMMLWHIMREIGFGATLRWVFTAGVGLILISLFSGSGSDHHHRH